MDHPRNNVLILLPASDSSIEMKYSKLIFWIFTAMIIIQAVAPINGVNSKMNHNYIFSIRLDYLCHAAMFAGLSVLFRVAYFAQPGFMFLREFLFFGVLLSTAFFSEAAQWLVPYRVFNMNDLIANFSGIILSIPLIRQRQGFFKRKYLQSGLN